MTSAVISGADWASVIDLTDGLDVVQIGCWEGHDTAAIARFAARVVAVGQNPEVAHGGFPSPFAQWRVITQFYGVAGKTLMLTDSPSVCLAAFVPDQFDVAVLDLSAFPAAGVYGLIPATAHIAQSVIVIPVPLTGLDSDIEQTRAMGRTVRTLGGLWLIETPETEEKIESKEGD